MDELKAGLNTKGLKAEQVKALFSAIEHFRQSGQGEKGWQELSQDFLQLQLPFELHLQLYKALYPDWEKNPAPAWFPDKKEMSASQLGQWMLEKNYKNLSESYPDFHAWSTQHYPQFWQEVVEKLKIHFDQPYREIVDLSLGLEEPRWFPGSKLNIMQSCFQAAPEQIALTYQDEQGSQNSLSYQALDQLSNRVANSLKKILAKGDRAALIMPTTVEAVAIFIGLIKAGCVVVAIPDSFSAEEIATRLRISNTQLVFCQDLILRAGKSLALYERVMKADAPKTIVIPVATDSHLKLRAEDLAWQDFLVSETQFQALSMNPEDLINILFSSGTTGEPKAIPWLQATPIKCASDAYLHHNLQKGDVLCWPSNLGWMMGPWQIFAAFINQATLAIYNGAADQAFGRFVQDAKVTHLGVIPTLVRQWRSSACMESLDWQNIKIFTSTGERSNSDDMLYLMWLAHYRPVIEYCGGTEVAGAYITGTVLQPSVPAAFSTATLGLDFVLLNEQGQECDKGEVALIPPSIGLSTSLLNKSHHQVYFADMPALPDGRPLRRHGDQAERLVRGYYRLLGRVDDTMNLGGIKISSAEIESLLNPLEGIEETAAVALDLPDGSPTRLIIYAVLKAEQSADSDALKKQMQKKISHNLNPLFKIHEVFILPSLPRTASNKVMRRVLRDNYLSQYKDSLKNGSS